MVGLTYGDGTLRIPLVSAMPTPPQSARFLFVTCQVGAEKAVKGEVAQRWPDFRLAFSRPGFLTFKLPEEQFLAPDFNLSAVFARAYGFSLGKVSSERSGHRRAAGLGPDRRPAHSPDPRLAARSDRTG